jgi:hypothetical protein
VPLFKQISANPVLEVGTTTALQIVMPLYEKGQKLSGFNSENIYTRSYGNLSDSSEIIRETVMTI